MKVEKQGEKEVSTASPTLKERFIVTNLNKSFREGDLNTCSVKIPRSLKVSSRYEDNNLDIVRRKLRLNKFFHQQFNPALDNFEGSRYYEGVYDPSQQYSSATFEKEDETKNLYEFIVAKGFYKGIDKKHFITNLRTGYDPKKQKEQYEKFSKKKRLKEYRHMLHEVDEQNLFMEFIDQLNKSEIENDMSLDPEKKNKIEQSTQITMKKFMPNNFTNSFTVMRAKLEKQIEEGASFKNNQEKVKTVEKETLLSQKSPIEKQWQEIEKERIRKEEIERAKVKYSRISVEEILNSSNRDSQLEQHTLMLKGINRRSMVGSQLSNQKPSFNFQPNTTKHSSQVFAQKGTTIDMSTIQDYSSINLVIGQKTKGNLNASTVKGKSKFKKFEEHQSKWKIEFGKIRDERIRKKLGQDYNPELSPSQNSKDDSVSQGSFVVKRNLSYQASFSQKSEAKSQKGDSSHHILKQKKLNSPGDNQPILSYSGQTKNPFTNFKRDIPQEDQKDFVKLNKDNLKTIKIAEHRPWTSSFNDTLFDKSMRLHSQDNRRLTKKPRNISTAAGSLPISTRAGSIVSPSTAINLQQSQNMSIYSQQLKNSSLSNIVQLCDAEDIQWLKHTEQERHKTMIETQRKEEEIKQAVDNYLDLMRIGFKQTPKIYDILELNKEIDSYDYHNFLAPNLLKQFKEENYKNTLDLIKDMGRRRIWQPDKFHISKKSDVADSISTIK